MDSSLICAPAKIYRNPETLLTTGMRTPNANSHHLPNQLSFVPLIKHFNTNSNCHNIVPTMPLALPQSIAYNSNDLNNGDAASFLKENATIPETTIIGRMSNSILDQQLHPQSQQQQHQPKQMQHQQHLILTNQYANQVNGGASTFSSHVGHSKQSYRLDDLIHLCGPLTEDAVMKTLQARFNENCYFVSIIFNIFIDILLHLI